MRKRTPYLAWSVIPLLIVGSLLKYVPDLVENFYSQGLYPFIAISSRWLSGLFGFSIGDVLYVIILAYLPVILYKRAKYWLHHPIEFLRSVFSVIAILLIVFYTSWGLNYYRLPIEKNLHFSTEYSQEELEVWVEDLIQKTNELHFSITRDSSVKVTLNSNTSEIYKGAVLGFKGATLPIKNIHYPSPSIKNSLLSTPLSYMGYGGYFNPFTHEAQVNNKIPSFRLPSISCHEIAHQLGYASESETNFIGFLVASKHTDIYFRYSAYHSMLSYGLMEIKKTNPSAFDAYLKKINPAVLDNYRELSEFWISYENPLEPLFKWGFDSYLKINNQSEGIQSYNRVVGLLIGYERKTSAPLKN